MCGCRRLLCVVVGIVAVASAGRTAIAGFAELMQRVPAEANVIVLVDVARLMASPMAQRDGWKDKQAQAYAERPLAVPPKATKIVRSARVDLQTREAQWQLALIELPGVPTIDEIAQREKGYTDTIASKKVAWSPRGAYVVTLGRNAAGMLFPPNRQFLARWIKQPSGRVSEYLLQATQSMSSTEAQMLIAVDLEDAIDPQQVRAAIDASPAVRAAKVDPAAVAQALDGLRGVKFEVIIRDKPWGRLMLEFNDDPSALAPVAAPLVVETLNRMGAQLSGLASWTAEQGPQSISLHGQLSESDVLRLGSVLELPSMELDESAEPVGADKPKLYATQNHFKAVNKLLDDLMSQKKEAITYGQIGMWVEQYAKRIDRLPILNVDEDMQNYSAEVAEDLRQIATSIKGAGVRTGMQAADIDSAGASSWGSYDGYYGTRQVAQERRRIRAQERGQSTLSNQEIAEHIRSETSRIRRQMTERYNVEF